MNTKDITAHIRLKLNIEHPDYDECFAEGYEFAQSNLPEEDNPFPNNSKEHEYWMQGWWSGFYGEKAGLLASDGRPQLTLVSSNSAANQDNWGKTGAKQWAGRVAKIAGAIAVTVAALELIDMAV